MTTSTKLVNGVDFVTVPTQDLDAARAFYGDVLGLEPSAIYQRGDAPAIGAEFETGNLTLSLMHMASIGVEFRPLSAPIALHVDDLPVVRAELQSRGVVFAAETMDTGVCFMAHFRDPDGNPLMLHHRHAPRD